MNNLFEQRAEDERCINVGNKHEQRMEHMNANESDENSNRAVLK